MSTDYGSYKWPPDGSGSGNMNGVANFAAVSNGASTLAVSYSAAFANTNYSLTTSLRNIVDGAPIFLNIVSTAKSTTGFTVTFNAPADSANYYVEYIAVGIV